MKKYLYVIAVNVPQGDGTTLVGFHHTRIQADTQQEAYRLGWNKTLRVRRIAGETAINDYVVKL